jgi:outer membrane protein TolC
MRLLIVAGFLLTFSALQAQDMMDLSLDQACKYAQENSPTLKNAQVDVEIAKKKIWETTAIGLPQISGSVEYQNFLNIPTSLLPDFISPSVYGVLLQEGLITPAQMPSASDAQFFPVQFGTQHNASFGTTLSQLIFSGQYIVGLQASKVFGSMSEQSLQKNQTDIRYSITETYCLILSLQENTSLLDSNLLSFKKLLNESEIMYKQGFVEEINVDQIRLNVSTLENAVSSLRRQIEGASMLLKFQIGMPMTQQIRLTDNLEGIMNGKTMVLTEDAFNPTGSIDYQIMETQVKLQQLSLKREQSTYLPSLTGFFSYSNKAMSNKFNFFSGDQSWYPTTLVGFKLEIPIWSSGIRHSKVQQAQLNVEKSITTRNMVSESLKLQYEQARISYLSAIDKYNHEKQNVNLTNKIFEKTMIKYREGIASSMELTQAQMQYQTSQSNYFAAMFELIVAKNKMEKLLEN